MLVERMTQDDLEAVRAISELTDGQYDAQAELARTYARVWVAREAAGAAPVAFALAWLVADEVHLLHLGTHPAARRRGAARALIDAIVREAATRQARAVLLEVRRSNLPARTLYESAGFQVDGTRLGYYRDGEDAIEMLFTLVAQRNSKGETAR